MNSQTDIVDQTDQSQARLEFRRLAADMRCRLLQVSHASPLFEAFALAAERYDRLARSKDPTAVLLALRERRLSVIH